MTDSVVSLAALRREIDRIDEAIHDLLMRRTEAVLGIAAAKRESGEPVLRPAREAEVLRRLVARHRGAFPKPALVRLWREIMAGSVHVQAPISLAVFAPQGQGGLVHATHDHFGTSTAVRRHDRAQSVLAEVSDGRAAVGILPLPAEEDPDPWWPALVGAERTTPRIVARLPFVPGNNPALAVALFEQEASGADHSYLILETPDPVSRHALTEALTAAALPPVFLATTREFYLAEVADFVGRGDARLARIAPVAGRAVVVGGYAVPFTAAEMGL
jgi:chorismate mutase